MDTVYVTMALLAPRTPTTIRIRYADGPVTQVNWDQDPNLLSWYVGKKLASALCDTVLRGIIGPGTEFSFIEDGRSCVVRLMHQ